MDYLGTIKGQGTIIRDDKHIARARYDFDGFHTRHGGVTCNGEIQTTASALGTIFGHRGIQLQTDDGRVLEIRFSGKSIGSGQEAAHVDVRGQIPGDKKREWRRRLPRGHDQVVATTIASSTASYKTSENKPLRRSPESIRHQLNGFAK